MSERHIGKEHHVTAVDHPPQLTRSEAVINFPYTNQAFKLKRIGDQVQINSVFTIKTDLNNVINQVSTVQIPEQFRPIEDAIVMNCIANNNESIKYVISPSGIVNTTAGSAHVGYWFYGSVFYSVI